MEENKKRKNTKMQRQKEGKGKFEQCSTYFIVGYFSMGLDVCWGLQKLGIQGIIGLSYTLGLYKKR